MHLDAGPQTFANAKYLREHMTEAENILWRHLSNRQMEDVKFRRQHPIHRFVVDFYAYEIKFVIELDGNVHMEPEQIIQDEEKMNTLKNYNLQFLRFKNEDVIYRLPDVLNTIREKIRWLKAFKNFDEE
jgi:very-short-patch-repair endonuclease